MRYITKLGFLLFMFLLPYHTPPFPVLTCPAFGQNKYNKVSISCQAVSYEIIYSKTIQQRKFKNINLLDPNVYWILLDWLKAFPFNFISLKR